MLGACRTPSKHVLCPFSNEARRRVGCARGVAAPLRSAADAGRWGVARAPIASAVSATTLPYHSGQARSAVDAHESQVHRVLRHARTAEIAFVFSALVSTRGARVRSTHTQFKAFFLVVGDRAVKRGGGGGRHLSLNSRTSSPLSEFASASGRARHRARCA